MGCKTSQDGISSAETASVHSTRKQSYSAPKVSKLQETSFEKVLHLSVGNTLWRDVVTSAPLLCVLSIRLMP